MNTKQVISDVFGVAGVLLVTTVATSVVCSSPIPVLLFVGATALSAYGIIWAAGRFRR